MFQPLFLLPAPRLRCQLRRGCACPSGATVLDYDYDALGQMTRQRDEQGQRYFSYDVTGKTTGVYLDAARQQPLVTFAYDDRGFQVSKTAYANGAAKTTYYVRDVAGNVLAVYEKPTASSPIQRSEVPLYGASRVGTLTRLPDGSEDYRYELNDHLGDARVVFHRPTTTAETETMELSGVSGTAAFQNNNLYRAGGGYLSKYAARLTNSQPAGQELKRVLTVAKGDTITFSAVGKLQEDVAARTSPAVQPYLLLGATSTDELPKTGPEAQQQPAGSGRWPGKLAAGLGIVLNQRPTQQRLSLQGWLKYRVLDDQGNQVSTDMVYMGGQGYWQQLQLGVRVAQGGTVELIAGTSGTGEAAYFDDLRVEQTGGLIVQEQHQYAFGAPLPGLSYTVGNMRYRHGYQGQYAEKDEETGFESFELRLYNSRIGRWNSADPYGQYMSPYVSVGNNPVSGTDPDGGWGGPGPAFNVALSTASVTAKSVMSTGLRLGLQAGSSIMKAADAYGRYGVGVWKGVGGGIYETASFTVGLLPFTSRPSWQQMGQGLYTIALISSPTITPDKIMLEAGIAENVANYVNNIPNMTAEEIGYSVGFAGEQIAESIALKKGLALVNKPALRITGKLMARYANGGHNSVSFKNAAGTTGMRYDLAGAAHYSKKLKQYTPTPHKLPYRLNVGPTGQNFGPALQAPLPMGWGDMWKAGKHLIKGGAREW